MRLFVTGFVLLCTLSIFSVSCASSPEVDEVRKRQEQAEQQRSNAAKADAELRRATKY